MATIELLTKAQLEIAEEFQRIWTNFKKDSTTRHSVPYFKRRLADINNLWGDFVHNNDRISKLRTDNPDHEYFTKNFWSQMEVKYKQIAEVLENGLAEQQAAMVQASPSQSKDQRQGPVHPEQHQQRDHEDLPSRAPQHTSGSKPKSGVQQKPVFKRIAVMRSNFLRNLQSIDASKSNVILQFKLAQIREGWTNIVKINEDIMATLEERDYEESYINNGQFLELEELYQEAYCTIQEALTERTNVVKETEAKASQIKLPSVNIPVFSGCYEDWTTFWELFERLIHHNQDLTQIEKMQYLKGSIRGDAARLLSHVAITSANYATAIELLLKRFHNPALLVGNHIKRLLNLKNVRAENASDLKGLFDSVKEILASISNLGVDVSSWDPLVIQLVLPKLDIETTRMYQQQRGTSTEIPTLKELLNPIEVRFRGLENLRESKDSPVRASQRAIMHITSNNQCVRCQENHYIFKCPQFNTMTPIERREYVRRNQLCFNCLREGHAARECSSKTNCRFCNLRHHSLLHSASTGHNQGPQTQMTPSSTSGIIANTTTTAATAVTVLLGTAILRVQGKGNVCPVRALIDSGSQTCLITEELARKLRLPTQRYETEIKGINGQSSQTVAKVVLTLESVYDVNQRCEIEAVIMPTITTVMPSVAVSPEKWSHIHNLQLADPWYFKPRDIELLLGADTFPEIMTGGLIKGPVQTPVAQNTIFGWILSGPVPYASVLPTNPDIISCLSVEQQDDNLRRFWELEEVPRADVLTLEERKCEQHFTITHSRNETGRYIVRLPLTQPGSTLGDSKRAAMTRLLSLERRLSTDSDLRREYNKFMEEYMELGHMSEATPSHLNTAYYLPHHAVIKHDSTTTKLRVVFDASMKTTSGRSLNNILLVGPTVQRNLFQLLLQWRTMAIVFTADIEKMYRQILMHEEDRDLQRILWRDSPSRPVKEYALNTVTYGTSSAPFLAIRTLNQLATDYEEEYPLGSRVLKQCFYVDDCLGGADTVEECRQIQRQLVELLNKGGFKLRKWTSNNSQLLQRLPGKMLESMVDLDLENTDNLKILGLKWCPITDSFHFTINIGSFGTANTKRGILSDAARLFDPLGWLSPVTTKAKIMIQKLWLLGIGWDEEAPVELQKEWDEFKTRLLAISQIKIPRWTQQSSKTSVELHGFSDASEKAYAAVVYLRVRSGDDVSVTLLTSKTKVAPVKQITLARLELCALGLLVKLISHVQQTQGITCSRVFGWTDSQIVLNWVTQHPVKWTTFVANRVSHIQENFKGQLRFVSGKENPADIPSRGQFGDGLVDNELWWRGPHWLRLDKGSWPQNPGLWTQNIPETRKAVVCTTVKEPTDSSLVQRYSSWKKLLRVTAYCLRFIKNAQSARQYRETQVLTNNEIQNAKHKTIQFEQRLAFKEELTSLLQSGQVNKTSSLRSLNPFIDNNGIIRVGGRLKHSILPTAQKHPIILRPSSHITKLIIHQAHIDAVHGGVKLTLSAVRNEFWIIRGTNAVKSHIQRCLRCCRYTAKTQAQLMGQLPPPRVQYSRPFAHCGVDYAGPLQLRSSHLRGCRTYKGYIALFVCLATKAVHIELVSDLSAEGFLAALRRMTNRRGGINHIYSDNGTNFVGANNALERTKIQQGLSDKNIQWHFIPPGSPHFGGIWESGIKSVKHHLVRVIGAQILSYEEMNTIIIQIEGCLNSRPLCPLSDNPEDIDALTPGHFLTGSAITSPTQDNMLTMRDSNFKRWKLVQQIKQDVCKRWHQEYMRYALQRMKKWTKITSNVRVGQLVLLRDEVTNPSEWPLGRIQEVHQGSDNLVRVVSVKTLKGVVKRTIQRLCILPSENDDSHSVTKPRVIPSRQHTHRPTTARVSLIALTLFTCFIFGATIPPTHTITYPNPGLFIERLGVGKTQRGILRTSILFSNQNIMRDLDNSRKAATQLETLCNRTKLTVPTIQCDDLIKHVKDELHNLQVIFNRIEIENGTTHTIAKRGLVGTVLTSLFGVNDEVYHDIEALDKNQRAIIRTAKANAKIMISTMAAVNSTETRIASKMDIFRGKLNEGLRAIDQMQGWHDVSETNRMTLYLLNAFLTATSYLKEVETKYSVLLSAYLKRSHLYEFLSHEEIAMVISRCADKIGPAMEVVTRPLDQLDFVRESANIVVHGYFAIIDTEEYELIRITTVPERLEDGVYREMLLPMSTFGVNYEDNRYFEFSTNEFKQAMKVNESTVVLHPTVFFNIDHGSNCIINQMRRKFVGTTCPTRRFQVVNTIWKELWTRNAWMFITPTLTTIQLACHSGREEIVLNCTGILHISSDCTVHSKLVSLEGSVMKESQTVTHYVKAINLENATFQHHHIPLIVNETVLPLEHDFATLFTFNQQQAEDNLLDLENTSWKSIIPHQYWVKGCIWTIGGLLILAICIVSYRCHCQRKTTHKTNLKRANPINDSNFEIDWAL